MTLFTKNITAISVAILIATTPASAFESKYLRFANNAKWENASSAVKLASGEKFTTIVRQTAVNLAVDTVAVPATVAGAGAVGVTASTGTAVASLSGAAATSATVAAVGAPVAEGLATVGIVAFAPFEVGLTVIGLVAAGGAWGINKLLD